MTVTLTTGAVTATTASLQFATMGASGSIELQLSSRRDFAWCVCPIVTIPRASPYSAQGLNQGSRYFARARTRLGDGTAEPWSNVVAFRTPVANAQNLTVPAVIAEPALIVLPETVIAWNASNQVPGYPVTNLGIDSPVAWRSVRPDGIHTFNMIHAGAPWDTIAFLAGNAPETATITVTGGNTGFGDTVIIGPLPYRASANVTDRRGYHGLIRLPAPVTFRMVQVVINTGPLPGNLFHLEHAVIGLNRMTKNAALDDKETPMNLGGFERTRSGVPDRIDGLKMRKVEFELAMLTETQYETNYRDLMFSLNDPILVAPNSKSGPFLHDRLAYGDLSGGDRQHPYGVRFGRSFSVDSLI